MYEVEFIFYTMDSSHNGQVPFITSDNDENICDMFNYEVTDPYNLEGNSIIKSNCQHQEIQSDLHAYKFLWTYENKNATIDKNQQFKFQLNPKEMMFNGAYKWDFRYIWDNNPLSGPPIFYSEVGNIDPLNSLILNSTANINPNGYIEENNFESEFEINLQPKYLEDVELNKNSQGYEVHYESVKTNTNNPYKLVKTKDLQVLFKLSTVGPK